MKLGRSLQAVGAQLAIQLAIEAAGAIVDAVKRRRARGIEPHAAPSPVPDRVDGTA